MAVDSFRIRHPRGKFRMLSFETVYKSVKNHPFIVIMVLFLILLHRYFPFLFSLLVSTSPVLVCTAVLLGTLLIHGQPNDHKVENHGETRNMSVTLRTGVVDHMPCVDSDEISVKNRFAEVRKDIVEKGIKVSGVVGSRIRANDDFSEEVGWEYCDSELNCGSQTHEEKSEVGLNFADFRVKDVEEQKDRAQNRAEKHDERVQDGAGMENRVDSSLDQMKHVDDTDRDSLDSESDAGEKSSLDALVADVIPTPQETFPLLDSEEPLHHDNITHDASPRSELQSAESNQSSRDTDEETDYKDEEGDDENDDDDDEETLKPIDDGGKSAIRWTEDDQKMFLDLRNSEMEKNHHLESLIARMSGERYGKGDEKERGSEDDDDDDDDDDGDDEEEEEEDLDVEKGGSEHVTLWTEEDERNLRDVGSSELERNQRLENLLARRRAQRNFSMISERNLIDLDLTDLPFQVAPISTTQVNPFDTPDDANSNTGLPPIPGSAPSVTLPRKNPFESPCTSPKGPHNLTGESPKVESTEINHNTGVFHTDGCSIRGYNLTGDIMRPDFMEINRKDAVFRRYESFSPGYNFIGEASRQDTMEVNRRDPVFTRHGSFSTRSAFPGFSDGFHLKPVFVPEQLAQEVGHPSLERQSNHGSESTASSGSDAESSAAPVCHADVGSDHDQDEPITDVDHASTHSESDHESESSDLVDSLQNDQEEHSAASLEVNVDDIYQNTEETDDNLETASSSSMTSEDDDGSTVTAQTEGQQVEESVFSPKASLEVSDVSHGSIEEDHIHKEPVYDTSPSGFEKNRPFSSPTAQI